MLPNSLTTMTYKEFLRIFKREFEAITGFSLDDMSDHDFSVVYDEYSEDPKMAARAHARAFLKDPEGYEEDTFFENL